MIIHTYYMYTCTYTLHICIYIRLFTCYGRLQVRLVEGVSDIPAQRTELPPLLNIRVKEAQTAQQLLPLPGFIGRQSLVVVRLH